MLKGERLSLHESTKGRFQGISCAYLNSSDKIITVCEGFADKESSIPVDENTIFPACSISKFITALCVMKANEKEIISIDAPVNNYLSKWKLCTVNGNESDGITSKSACGCTRISTADSRSTSTTSVTTPPTVCRICSPARPRENGSTTSSTSATNSSNSR